MKKFLFFILLSCMTIASYASEETHRVYCELLGWQKGLLSTKVKITVDFGQEVSIWKRSSDNKLVDDEGKEMVFNSMVDAMNFMGTIGWKFQQAYVVTEGGQNVYHWLLYKDIVEGEDIMDGFMTKGAFKAAQPLQTTFVLQFLKRKVKSNEWDLVKEETKKLSQDELNTIVDNWKSQTTENTIYDVQIKKEK